MIHPHRRWEDLVAGFRWDVPEEFNFGAPVDAWATDRSAGVALYWEDEAGREERLDVLGPQAGVEPGDERARRRWVVARGDPVLVMLPRIPAWQVAMLAGMKLGALVIPCTASLRAKDIAYRARHSGARAIVTTVEQAPEVDAALADEGGVPIRVALGGAPAGWHDWDALLAAAQPTGVAARTRSDEPALCFYTSGTTKDPKAVLHTHAYTVRASLDGRVLARPPAHGPPLDDRRHRLGQGGVRRALRSVDERRAGLHVQRPLRSRARARSPRALRDIRLLRAADGVPPAGEAGPLALAAAAAPPLRRRRRAAQPRGDRTPGTRPSDSSSTTATDRPRARSSPPTSPGCRSGRGSMGKPFPGHDLRVIDDAGVEAARRRGRRPGAARPSAVALPRVLEGSRGDGRVPARRVVPHRRPCASRRGRLPLVRRPRRRRHHLRRLPHRPVRGRERAARASRRSSSRRWWRAPTPIAGEIVKAFVVLRPGHAPADALAQQLQDHVKRRHRAVQVSARDRVRRRAAEDGERQDPARRAARARAGAEVAEVVAPERGDEGRRPDGATRHVLVLLACYRRRPAVRGGRGGRWDVSVLKVDRLPGTRYPLPVDSRGG